MGWTDKESAVAIDFSFLQSIQTGCGALLFIYPVSTRGGELSQRVKQLGMKLNTQLHLVLRLRMLEVYLHYSIHLHNVMLN
jgi:hypothetical protein